MHSGTDRKEGDAANWSEIHLRRLPLRGEMIESAEREGPHGDSVYVLSLEVIEGDPRLDRYLIAHEEAYPERLHWHRQCRERRGLTEGTKDVHTEGDSIDTHLDRPRLCACQRGECRT